MVVGVDSLRLLKFFGITCRENPGPLDENLSEVVRVPDVVPESLRSFHQFDSPGLGVFCGLAALGLSLAEDDVASEVHQPDGD
jgi:hypothetical protein